MLFRMLPPCRGTYVPGGIPTKGSSSCGQELLNHGLKTAQSRASIKLWGVTIIPFIWKDAVRIKTVTAGVRVYAVNGASATI